jgi:hypothetical protein
MRHFKFEAKRIAVSMRDLGLDDELIIAAIGCSIVSIDRWQRNYAAYGDFAGVAEPQSPGRPRTMSQADAEMLIGHVLDDPTRTLLEHQRLLV